MTKLSKDDIDGLKKYGFKLADNNSPFDRIKVDNLNILNKMYLKDSNNKLYKCQLGHISDICVVNHFYVSVEIRDYHKNEDNKMFKHLFLAEAYFSELYNKYGNLSFWDRIKIWFGLW